MKVYAVKHIDEQIRANSRSGGIFTAISDQFLNGGVVYGCILNDNFDAIHIRAEIKEERDKMRGSKYIQSTMGTCFQQVKKDLADGKRVLFSGTSCQVSGLLLFLQKDYPNLFTLDILCHGVPSKKVWHSYLDWTSKGKVITGVNFRNKTDFGWAAHVETISMGENKVNSDIFKNLFYGHNILRPSCYKCPYKSINHAADLTIGDYWRIDKAAPGFNDNKGVSLVMVNTLKGEALFNNTKNQVEWIETKIEDSMQPALKAPFRRPHNRNQFWEDFEKEDFSYIAQKYGVSKPTWKRYAKKVRRLIKKMFHK